MFLNRLLATNSALAELAFEWHGRGVIQPDTYLLDLDVIQDNACLLHSEAVSSGVTLYYMLKQIGRNPMVGRAIQDVGFCGAVCVDWREALTLSRAGLALGNVGHLVQTPASVLPEIIAARPDIMTVYSIEKAAQIGAEASRQGHLQPIMLRVLDDGDVLYEGQYAGFRLDGMRGAIESLEKIDGIKIAGVCSFPCFLFSEQTQELEPLPNMQTVLNAAEMLRQRGYDDLQINMPSANCVKTIAAAAAYGGTHFEPGHALTGTTPYHAVHDDAPERIGYVYVSEVSHNLDGCAYCFGGGHYRRGHMLHGLVGTSLDGARMIGMEPPSDENIDYHLSLSESARVGDTVVACCRTQMFVTRSEIAVVSGLSHGKPVLEGVFSSLGERIR